MAAQHARADRMEGAEPGHALHRLADQPADPLPHLARRLVGEGDGEDLRRPGTARVDEMGEAGGERRGLAGAGAGEDEHRPFGGQHRVALRRVEAGEIGRILVGGGWQRHRRTGRERGR